MLYIKPEKTSQEIQEINKAKQQGETIKKEKQDLQDGDFLGFDLIIGNPPYIRQEKIKHLKAQLSKYKIHNNTADIYTYFFELGFNLLAKHGVLSLITSNKYNRAGYGGRLREFILENAQILSYVELNGIKVFDAATVDTGILTLSKTKPSKDSRFIYKEPKNDEMIESSEKTFLLSQKDLTKEAFIFADSNIHALKAKIESKGVPLKEWDISIYRGILTGYNPAFIITTATRDSILKQCDNTDKSLLPIARPLSHTDHSLRHTDHSLRHTERSETSNVSHHTEQTSCHADLSYHTNTSRHTDPSCHVEPSFRHTERSEVSKSKLSTKQKIDVSPTAQHDEVSTQHDEVVVQHDEKSARYDDINSDHILLNEYERTKLLIKPILRGRDIKRYSYQWDNLWVINTHNGYKIDNEKTPPIDINEYPALKNHLDRFYPHLQKRSDKGSTPYNLRNCAYLPLFDKEKIVWNPVSGEYFFTYIKEQMYFNNSLFMITHNIESNLDSKDSLLLYILGLMNSTLYKWLMTQMTNLVTTGQYAYGSKDKIENLPIPKINAKQEKQITDIVNEILELKNTPSLQTPTPSCHSPSVMLSEAKHLKEKHLKSKEKQEKRYFANAQYDEMSANDEKMDCHEISNEISRNDKNLDSINSTDSINSINNTKSLESNLDQLIYQLYDLTQDEINLIES